MSQSATAGERRFRRPSPTRSPKSTASLVEQIERTLRFVESQRRHQHPTSLWLMGGGASVRNIGPYLSAALDMPVSIWRCADRARPRRANCPSRQAALFGPALGPFRLGVEGRMKTAINLLPPVYRRQRLVRRRAIQWSRDACWPRCRHDRRRALVQGPRIPRRSQRQLAAVTREGRPAQTMLREIAGMRNQIEQTAASPNHRPRTGTTAPSAGAVGRREPGRAQQTEGRLRVVDCRVVDLQATEVARESAAKARPMPAR